MTDSGNTDSGSAGNSRSFTQEDVNKILAEERRKIQARYADYDELKARAAEADRNKSALEKLLEKVSGLEERAAKAEEAALRADVAQAKGLTPAQAKRLQGKTREELEADAEELLAMFRPAAKDDKDHEDDGGGGDNVGGGSGKDQAEGGKDAGGGADSGKTGGEARRLPPATSRPKEKLTAGAVPAASGDKSAAELAEQILKDPF